MLCSRHTQVCIRVSLLCSALIAPSLSKAQTSLVLPTQVILAITDAEEARSKLVEMKSAASEAMQGKIPTMGSDWDKIGEHYEKAAKDMSNAPLPTEYVSKKNVVSADEYLSCSTRPAALAKLNLYLSDLLDAKAGGYRERSRLHYFQAKLDRAGEALDYLKSVHAEVATKPIIGDQFAADWYSLDRYLSPALSKLKDAAKNQLKRVDDNLNLLNAEIANYQANLATINGLSVCSPLAGNWAGTGTSGTIYFGGQPYCLYQTTMDQVHLNVSINQTGSVTGGSGSAVMHETLTSNCPYAATGTRGQQYNYVSGTLTGNSLHVEFVTPPGAAPRCTAEFNGTVVNQHLSGSFMIRRIDGGGPKLNWNIGHMIH